MGVLHFFNNVKWATNAFDVTLRLPELPFNQQGSQIPSTDCWRPKKIHESRPVFIRNPLRGHFSGNSPLASLVLQKDFMPWEWALQTASSDTIPRMRS